MDNTNTTYLEDNSTTNTTILVNTSLFVDDFYTNGTEYSEDPVPNWLINIYFVVISCGAAVNLMHVLALVRCRRNGTLSFILQLSFVDVLLLYVALTEVISLQKNTWIYSINSCLVFKGTEILANSLTLYLIICLNFHIVSLWNLHKWEIQKNTKNPLTSCSDSNECLVTRNENANRLVTIDYRKRKNDVSVILPSILIWSLCLSLSIPSFTLSSTLKLHENNTLCAIVDDHYGEVLQYLLLIFRIIVPVPILLLTLVILAIKLFQTSQKDIDNVLTKKFDEIRILLIFTITLTVLYILTSLQRYLLYFLHVISYPFDTSALTFKLPPLYNSYISYSTTTYLSMLHYSCTCLRGFLSFYMLPKFKDLVKSKICFCNTFK